MKFLDQIIKIQTREIDILEQVAILWPQWKHGGGWSAFTSSNLLQIDEQATSKKVLLLLHQSDLATFWNKSQSFDHSENMVAADQLLPRATCCKLTRGQQEKKSFFYFCISQTWPSLPSFAPAKVLEGKIYRSRQMITAITRSASLSARNYRALTFTTRLLIRKRARALADLLLSSAQIKTRAT